MATLLICDDEKNIRRSLRLILSEDHEVLEAGSAEEAFGVLEHEPVDLLILDVRLPGMSGVEALPTVRKKWPLCQVLMISGDASLQEAVEATRLGAYDFFEKPLDRARILITVRNCLERAALQQQLEGFAETEEEIVGSAPAIQEVKSMIAKVAPTSGRVLITGESGTGKELIARAIHRQSKRRDHAFVKVNCAAIPAELIESELFGHERGAFTGATARKKGRFELADGGTLFLDEIGDMPAGAQAKVLRALQSGEVLRVGGERSSTVDVRVIAATNKDLKAEVAEGRFREDLYFRLNVVPIHAPPLRERTEDIALLVESFLARLGQEHGVREPTLEADALPLFQRYPWPGNVRELRNMLERLIILAGGSIRTEDLPPELRGGATIPTASPGETSLAAYRGLSLRELREAIERDFIRETLEACSWNVTRAAEQLGVERTNLHKKIKHHGIERGG
ncbi:MAG: sigma-54 dependent transcriptional regulator [Deltaproteobacteria bacterium]|nr:sigma-54 dependent transcriptional regulator [Deltaproteobacteria bacterium]